MITSEEHGIGAIFAVEDFDASGDSANAAALQVPLKPKIKYLLQAQNSAFPDHPNCKRYYLSCHDVA